MKGGDTEITRRDSIKLAGAAAAGLSIATFGNHASAQSTGPRRWRRLKERTKSTASASCLSSQQRQRPSAGCLVTYFMRASRASQSARAGRRLDGGFGPRASGRIPLDIGDSLGKNETAPEGGP